MAKRVKTKKGSIGKKALAAILAASMVLSSSAFSVLAADVPATIAQYASIVVSVDGGADFSTGATDCILDYTGQPQCPSVVVKAGALGSEEIVDPSNYRVVYSDNTEVGDAKIKIEAVGNELDGFGNKLPEVTFKIQKKNLNATNTTVKWNSFSGFLYNGENQNPTIASVSVKGVKTDKGLASITLDASDYEVGVVKKDAWVDLTADEDLLVAKNNEWADCGSEYRAVLKLTDKGKEGFTNKDYAASKAEGNYADFVITQVPFNITVENNSFPYSGEPTVVQKQIENIAIKDANTNKKLKSSDYELVYANDGELPTEVSVGSHSLIVKSTEKNYEAGSVKSSYNIVVNSLQDAINYYISNSQNDPAAKFSSSGFYYKDGGLVHDYTGESISPTQQNVNDFLVEVGKSSGMSLSASNCDVKIDKGTNVGTYYITVTGKNNLNESATIPFKIVATEIKNNWINTGFVGMTLENKVSSEAELNIYLNGTTTNNRKLEANKDFTYSVSTKVKEANGTSDKAYTYSTSSFGNPDTLENKAKFVEVTVKGTGNYTGEINPNVAVYGAISLNDSSITASVNGTWLWTGKQITPGVSDVIVKCGDKTLKGIGENEKNGYSGSYDFTVEYGANIDAGENKGEITIKGAVTDPTSPISGGTIGYYGTRKLTFDIVGTDVNTEYKLAPLEDKTWTGTAADIVNAATLKLLYLNGNQAVNTGNIINTSKAVYYINGEKQEPSSNQSSYQVAASKTLTQEKCPYLIKIEVPGTGKYSGNLVVGYSINGKDASNFTVDPIADTVYDGKKKEPVVTVKDTNGVTLSEGSDYDVAYSDNVNAGIAAVILTFKGKYTGKKLVPFEIKKADATVELDAAQKTELEGGVSAGSTMELKLNPSLPDEKLTYTVATDNTNVVGVDGTTLKFEKAGTANITITPTSSNLNLTPATITVAVKVTGEAPAEKLVANCTPSRLKKVKNSFTVTTSTVKGADKWVIRYSLKNLNKTTKGSAKVTFKDVNKVKQQVVKVNKSGAKYYVQCRVVKDGVKSAWSKVKTVKSR